jgi:hypothetical protein
MATNGTNAEAPTNMTNRVGRPRKAESFRRLVVAALATDPEVPTRDLLKRATEEGYDGQKSAFYALVASARDPSHATPRRPALPGELSRHDVIDVTIGEKAKRTRLFVSRLEYSRFVAATVIEESGLEPIARALCSHFAAFGGVPLLATFDSTRVGVAGTEEVALLAYLGIDLGVGIELPEANRPRTRATSRLARMIRVELLRPLTQINSKQELLARVSAFVDARNTQPGTDTAVAPIMLREEERRRLRPLRVSPADLTLRVPVVVQPGGVIAHDGRRWDVRAAVPGTSGMLYLSRDRVRVVAGNASAIFSRDT